MSDHDDLTLLLERQADAVPPPPDTDVDTVLQAGRRRRHRRHGGYAMAAVLMLVVAVGIGWQTRSTMPPVVPPEISQPFGPTLARVSVCEPGLDRGCQPVSEATLATVTDVIEASPTAEVVEIRDAEQVAAYFPSDDGSPPPEDFVQSLGSRVIFRIAETNAPMPLFEDLLALPAASHLSLGTATVAPIPVPGLAPPGEDPEPRVESTEYAQLAAPVAGSDQTIDYRVVRDDQGRLCTRTDDAEGCSWTPVAPGLISGGVGPWTEQDVIQRCIEYLVGYDVATVTVRLADGTTVPTASTVARPDLPWLRLVAGCWEGPEQPVTIIAHGADGSEIDRKQFDPPDAPPAPERTSQAE